MNTTVNGQVCMGQIPGLQRPVSRIFFGTANPPISTDEAAASDLLDSVLACGVNAFDSARSYGRWSRPSANGWNPADAVSRSCCSANAGTSKTGSCMSTGRSSVNSLPGVWKRCGLTASISICCTAFPTLIEIITLSA